MNTSLVFTFISKDRPGLVEALSERIAEHDGSWQESRMIQLAGQFAGIGRLSLPATKLAAVRDSLSSLSGEGIIVSFDDSESEPPAPLEQGSCQMHILGNDRPGIVREVSRALKLRKINVTELNSNITSAPMTGEALFEAYVKADMPPGCDIDELEEALEEIAELLSIDIDIEPK
ncbi:glycine cleavage system protein R [Spongiibacter sp. KMU-166]|uniref:Glycine cleavage system transcriptional repressor n=1 Tax=Spongiibacter thalassae TaxID=2721624 RepID=A0ABX1GDM9_9GAMM|nr:ACT domain-containing protein [Spongiibacter thalassae]NKI17282.1 glycine cleavage system protein R [Spongiibacter thalassae]